MRFNTRKRGFSPALIGKSPTAAQKIVNVANKMGIPGIANQQGSPLNIFDTVLINGAAADRQVLTFFKNASGKSRNFTNWQALEFKAGETLAVEKMSILLLQLSAASLTADTTTITNVFPIGRNLASQTIAFGMAQFKIANTTVFKDLQLTSMLPQLNPNASGMATTDTATATQFVQGRSSMDLPVGSVIPPNQAIEYTLEIPPITTGAGNFAIMVILGDQGSIYSAKGTF